MATASEQQIERRQVSDHVIVNIGSALLIMLAISLLLALANSYRSTLGDVHDDAYISFRYAANLLHGHGLVYNVGEYVEGYTNFLWTMTATLLLGLGFDLGFATILLNGVFALLLLAIVGWYGLRQSNTVPRSLAAGALAVAMLTTSAFAYAMVGGLETVLFTLLLTAAVLSFVQEQQGSAKLPLAGGLFALAALTRPEGALFWGITVLYQFILMFRGKGSIPTPARGAGRVRALGPLVGGFLVIWLPYMVWKVFYYGSIFPNTFYDKATGNNDQLASGLGYVLSAWPYLFGPLAFVLATGVLIWRRRLRQTDGYFATLVVVNFAYVAYVGGDYLIGFRFLLPLAPLVALLVLAAASSLTPPTGLGMLGLLVAGTIIIVLLSPFVGLLPDVRAKLQEEAGYNKGAVQAANWLKQNAQPTDTLAIETAGKIPYLSGLPTIDMLGLTDAYIARGLGRSDRFIPGHNKTDVDYVLSRQPTYIMIYRIPLPDGSYGFNQKYMPASTALIGNPQFTAAYVPAAKFPMWPGVEGWLYKRR